MEDNFAKIRFNGDEDDEAAALGRHLCRRLYKSLRKSALTDITLVTDHGNPQRIEAHQVLQQLTRFSSLTMDRLSEHLELQSSAAKPVALRGSKIQ